MSVNRNKTDDYGIPIARITHSFTKNDRLARRALAKHAHRILRQAGALFTFTANFHSFSHAIGTCRFADDPRQSTLDRYCMVHGTSNIFVVDGSFMPTSGGVNPALTISANAVRVGEYIADQFPILSG